MVFVDASLQFFENGTLDDVSYNPGDNSFKVIIGTQVIYYDTDISGGGKSTDINYVLNKDSSYNFPGHGYWVSDRAYACDMRDFWGGWWVAYFYDATAIDPSYVDVTFVADNPNNTFGTYDPKYIPTEEQIKHKEFNNPNYGHRLSFVAPINGVIDYSLPYSQPWTHNTPWSGNLQSNYTNNIDWYSIQIIEKSTDIERFFGYFSIDDKTRVIQELYNSKNMNVNILSPGHINKLNYTPLTDVTGTITISGITFSKSQRIIPEIIIKNIPELDYLYPKADEWKITWKAKIDGTYGRILSYYDSNNSGIYLGDSLLPTSDGSLNQLKESYRVGWGYQYTMVSLYKLWYNTANIINKNMIIECRAYYKFEGLYTGYYTNRTNYDTTTGLYVYTYNGSGHPATQTEPNLIIDSSGNAIDENGNHLTLFYDSNVVGWVDLSFNLFNFNITPVSEPSCFNEGTKILCLNNNFEEEYIPIEYLQKGHLVKSYKHGYRKIDLIGNNPMINNPENFCGCMYKMEKTYDNGLIEDLILTGGHSILVDDLGSFKEENDKLFGSSQMIDDKYLLLSSVSDKFVKLDNTNLYTYYHFILENNGNDDDERFGVWANGILVETPTKKQFTNHVCYE